MKQRFTLIIFGLFIFSCSEKKQFSTSKDSIESAKNYKCFDGIGSTKNDKPTLTYDFKNGKSVSICGFVDKEMQEQGTIISEFNVFDCQNGKSYAEYGALKICRIVEKKNELEIQDLKYLPIGNEWNWELIQIGEQIIKTNGKELFVTELTPKIEKYTINEIQTNEFLDSLEPGKGFNSDWEQVIGKLESLSIIGNEKAWKILQNLENFTGLEFDGTLAEIWKESVTNVKWIRKI